MFSCVTGIGAFDFDFIKILTRYVFLNIAGMCFVF